MTSSFQEKTADGELIYAVDLDNGEGSTTTYYYTMPKFQRITLNGLVAKVLLGKMRHANILNFSIKL